MKKRQPNPMPLETEVGIPVAWQMTRLPRLCSPLLVRDYRRRRPTAINALLAMYAEVYHRRLRRPRGIGALGAVGWGAAVLPKKIGRWLARRGRAARRSYGRSLPGQALDMARVWFATGFDPSDYYASQLARCGGGRDIFAYVTWNLICFVVIELQRRTYGAPAVAINDKGAFAGWCVDNGIRTPRQFWLDPGAAAPAHDAILAVGDELIVKPRSSMMGQGVEAWSRMADGSWQGGERRLQTGELAQWLGHRASTDSGGTVVQERLRNPPELVDMCGEILSACRVITLMNERDDPEVVQFLWRMIFSAGAAVNNFSHGGMFWSGSDMAVGGIEYGLSAESLRRQILETVHPVTGRSMIGERHPYTHELCDFAVAGHRKLGDVLILGWDVAMTAQGPTVLEVNFPSGTHPNSQITTNGLTNGRYGEILAWRARRWLEAEVDLSSRRALGARWHSEE